MRLELYFCNDMHLKCFDRKGEADFPASLGNKMLHEHGASQGADLGIMHCLEHALEHTLKDSILVILVLFITYLVMEYLEHQTGNKMQNMVQKAGSLGPVLGALVGAVPQCGFSAAASNLYAGRLISMGTLIAIFLSTSDEMLPVMISAHAPMELIGGVLLTKIIVGMAAGFVIDFIFRNQKLEQESIHEVCEQEQCHCEEGIVHSALKHTVQVGAFILLISFALNLVLEVLGEDVLAEFLLNRPILGPVLAGLVGLVPNCAASVVITELFMEGVLGIGAMMAGLLVGAGVGLLVLFRVNHHRLENIKIVGILYFVGVLAGIVIEFIPI